MTQVTPGVPVRVAAVSALDPASITLGESVLDGGLSAAWRWTAWLLSAVALAVAAVSLVSVRRRCAARNPPEVPLPGDLPHVWLEACVHLMVSSGRHFVEIQPLRCRQTRALKDLITWRRTECAPRWFAISSSERSGPRAH